VGQGKRNFGVGAVQKVMGSPSHFKRSMIQ
jgi:hypothetical protein